MSVDVRLVQRGERYQLVVGRWSSLWVHECPDRPHESRLDHPHGLRVLHDELVADPSKAELLDSLLTTLTHAESP